MSRSFRKTPIVGYTASRSEKQDKRIASGQLRCLHRSLLAQDTDYIAPNWKKATGHGSWIFAKDGKSYLKKYSRFGILSDAYMQKLLRK